MILIGAHLLTSPVKSRDDADNRSCQVYAVDLPLLAGVMQLIVEDVVRPVTGQGLPHTVITVLLASKPTPDMVMLCPPPKLPDI